MENTDICGKDVRIAELEAELKRVTDEKNSHLEGIAHMSDLMRRYRCQSDTMRSRIVKLTYELDIVTQVAGSLADEVVEVRKKIAEMSEIHTAAVCISSFK